MIESVFKLFKKTMEEVDYQLGAGSATTITPKLSFFALPMQTSPEPAGTLTPPLRMAGSVPFLWEEAPGKPRLTLQQLEMKAATNKGLDLPPRLQSSPTTVLDGPDVARTLSFSFYREISPEKGQLGGAFGLQRKEGERFGGLWGRRGCRVKGRSMDFDERRTGYASMVFPAHALPSSSVSEAGDDTTKVKITRSKRRGGLLSISHATSHIWVSSLFFTSSSCSSLASSVFFFF